METDKIETFLLFCSLLPPLALIKSEIIALFLINHSFREQIHLTYFEIFQTPVEFGLGCQTPNLMLTILCNARHQNFELP